MKPYAAVIVFLVLGLSSVEQSFLRGNEASLLNYLHVKKYFSTRK